MKEILLLYLVRSLIFLWERLKLRLRHLKWELLLLGRLGFGILFLQGDSLIMIQALCESAPTPSSVASLVYGIAVVAHDFRSVNFSHVCRNGNIPTHLLAKYALRIVDYCAWIEESPCFIEKALLHDVSLASTN